MIITSLYQTQFILKFCIKIKDNLLVSLSFLRKTTLICHNIMKLFSTTTSSFFELLIQFFINQKNVYFILLIIVSFISFNSIAQSENSNAWQLLNSENGIEIYSQRISCDVQAGINPYDYVAFKAVNTTSESLTFGLEFEIYFEEGCNGCMGKEETSTEITLNSGSSIEGSCLNLENKLAYFVLNPNFDGSWKYTHSKVVIQPIK